MVKLHNGFELDEFQSFTDGAIPPPNFQSTHIDDAVRTIAGRFVMEALPFVRRVLLPDGRQKMARYYCNQTQGGGLDGSGLILWYDDVDKRASAASFAICIHDKVTAPGANPQREWHPGECGKCGLDMTVDSSG